MQHTIETLQSMGKNELTSHIISLSEENGINWAEYGSLNRKKREELVEIASEVQHAVYGRSETDVEPAAENDEVWYEDESEMASDASETWEYAEPNKPSWMQDRDAEVGFEDVEVNGETDPEEFEDVEQIEAVLEKAPKAKKAKKEKAPKAPKAPKAEKAPRTRTYTAEQIREMIELVEVANWKKAKVAEKFECSGTFIHNVLVGNVYRDITGRGQAKSE